MNALGTKETPIPYPVRVETLKTNRRSETNIIRFNNSLFTAAVEYLKKYAERQGAIPPYMRALGLGDRLPVASEEKYLNAWQEMGFPPEAVALAYDKTVLKCHELKWPYCNGILKRWHEAGLHTPEEIERADKPPAKQPTQSAGDAWKYV